jgi:hypothetical protein
MTSSISELLVLHKEKDLMDNLRIKYKKNNTIQGSLQDKIKH